MTKQRLLLRFILPFSLGVGVFAFIIAKAVTVQVTTDEAYTLTILTKETVWNLVSYESSYTNNHILNSLLCKLSFGIFGMNQVAGRLPNILSFILYFWFVWQFSRRFFKDDFVGLMFVAVMLGNPYMIEFFALARGYGLSIALMMTSIYFAANYVLANHRRSLSISLMCAMLSVYAQFALLHFFLGLNFLIFIFEVQKYLKTKNRPDILRGVGMQIIATILLGILVYAPFKAILKDNQISYYGSKNIWDDSIVSLISRSLYGQGYFSDQTVVVFKNLMVVLFIFLFLYCFNKFKNWKNKSIKNNNLKIENNELLIRKNKSLINNKELSKSDIKLLIENNELLIRNNELLINNNKLLLDYNQIINKNNSIKDPALFSFILLISIVFVITAQFYVLGTQYVVDRTALFLYPIIALNIPTVALMFEQKKLWAARFVAILFTVFCTWHISRSANLVSFQEWWFDKNTLEVLDDMKQEYQKMQIKRPIKLHTNCVLQPSFDYYYQEQHLDWLVEPFGWDNKVDTTRQYDFYYDLNDNWGALKTRYETLKSFDNGEYLLLKSK